MSNKVGARFYVQSVTRLASGTRAEGYAQPAPNIQVVMWPVTRGEENKQWASATPSGKIELTIGNPEAAAWFESMLGQDVAVTFEPRYEAEAALDQR